MGATRIMVIRHAEKPDKYDGTFYNGVDMTGATCGPAGAESLVTRGWERAGALVTLFAPPWGPRPPLAQPQYLYAANPAGGGHEHSQRPYETITALAARLNLDINASYKKKAYPEMVRDALARNGVVLICWQHEDIPLLNADNQPGLSQCILTETGTAGNLGIPSAWPHGPNGARYDLVWVFDRASGSGPITGFSLFAQRLLAGDAETA